MGLILTGASNAKTSFQKDRLDSWRVWRSRSRSMVNVNMRIVAVEEHFAFADLLARIDPKALTSNGWPLPGTDIFHAINPAALTEIGRQRIEAMHISI